MNVSAVLDILSNAMTNGQASSVFSRFVGATGIYGAVHSGLNFIMGLLYTVAKYLLYFVDLIYSYIQKLCGLDMSLESLDAMISEESDIVFNLLISGRDLVTMIIRNLIVLAIVLIIVFAIVAIIKGQYDAVKKGQETSPVEAIKTTFKAFILLLITPLIAIGGIIFSDLVLQTFYNATNVSGAFSLGTQVFMTSSASANAYRIYAQNDERIPITFDGSKNALISSYFSDHEVTEGFVKYLQESKNSNSEYNPLYATYMSFMTTDFTKFSDINDIVYPENQGVQETKALYDKFYDYNTDDGGYGSYNSSFRKLRRIECYSEFYYVMADVVDFCIQTASPVYFKTIEQVLDSIARLPDSVDKNSLFNLTVQQYGIEFYSGFDSTSETLDGKVEGVNSPGDYLALKRNTIKIIAFNSDYLSVSDNDEPEIRMQIPVRHIVGMTDELVGAKFIVAAERYVKGTDGNEYYYYEPFVNGSKVNGTKEFKSDYIRNGNIVVAKGIFQESMYPTAIRLKQGRDQSGKTVDCLEFYREDINAQAEGQMSDYLSFHVDTGGGLFGKLIKLIMAFFNPEELVPDIDINFDALVLDYVKGDTTPVDTLVDARMRIGYFMPYLPQLASPSIVKNMGLSFTGLYSASKLNFLLLVVGSILLLRVSFSAISSLIERAYELFLIFLTYPAACATIPIDGGNAYNTWLKGYMARIFRTYGFILGINFVLMLFPIIENIEYFTQDEIGTSKIVHRVGALFFSVMTVRQITNFMNLTVGILFELVAFTLIETIPEVISTIVAGQESALKLKDNNVFTKIKNTSVKFALAVGKVALPPLKSIEYIFSTNNHKKKMRAKLKEKTKDKLRKAGLGELIDNPKGFIPGAAFKQEAAFKARQKKAEENTRQSYEDLNKVLDDPNADKKAVKKAMAQFMGQQHASGNAATGKIRCPRKHPFASKADFLAAVQKEKEKEPTYPGGNYCPVCFDQTRELIEVNFDSGKEEGKKEEGK